MNKLKNYKNKKLNQSGFGAVEVLLVIIAFVLVVGVSIYSYNTVKSKDKEGSSTSSTSEPKELTSKNTKEVTETVKLSETCGIKYSAPSGYKLVNLNNLQSDTCGFVLKSEDYQTKETPIGGDEIVAGKKLIVIVKDANAETNIQKLFKSNEGKEGSLINQQIAKGAHYTEFESNNKSVIEYEVDYEADADLINIFITKSKYISVGFNEPAIIDFKASSRNVLDDFVKTITGSN